MNQNTEMIAISICNCLSCMMNIDGEHLSDFFLLVNLIFFNGIWKHEIIFNTDKDLATYQLILYQCNPQ